MSIVSNSNNTRASVTNLSAYKGNKGSVLIQTLSIWGNMRDPRQIFFLIIVSHVFSMVQFSNMYKWQSTNDSHQNQYWMNAFHERARSMEFNCEADKASKQPIFFSNVILRTFSGNLTFQRILSWLEAYIRLMCTSWARSQLWIVRAASSPLFLSLA